MAKPNIFIALPDTGDEEWQATRESFQSGWLTQGPKVAEFERQFAEHHNVTQALATTSCTTALHLILAGLGIGPGDEVIVPAFTWVATANVVMYCGATPIFADVDPKSFNIDPESVAEKITEKTKAVIVVHLFGLCADMDAIRGVVPDGISIIEDAACAAGSEYKGQFAGGLGHAAAFSFHPRKVITTGEGGMVTSNDTKLSQLMNKLRNHGAEISEEQRHSGPKPYLLPDFNLLGFNYRMTDLQASVGLVQLGKLEGFIAERRKWANFYLRELNSVKWLSLPTSDENFNPSWQAFVVNVLPDKAPMPRNDIMEILQGQGVATRPGTHAVHLLNFYADKFGFQPSDFPNAAFCHDNSMALPLHNKMTEQDYVYIVENILALEH